MNIRFQNFHINNVKNSKVNINRKGTLRRGCLHIVSLIYPSFRLDGFLFISNYCLNIFYLKFVEVAWAIEVRPFTYDLTELIVSCDTKIGKVDIVADVEVGQHTVEAYVESLELVVAQVDALEEREIAEVNISKVIPLKVYECEVGDICH